MKVRLLLMMTLMSGMICFVTFVNAIPAQAQAAEVAAKITKNVPVNSSVSLTENINTITFNIPEVVEVPGTKSKYGTTLNSVKTVFNERQNITFSPTVKVSGDYAIYEIAVLTSDPKRKGPYAVFYSAVQLTKPVVSKAKGAPVAKVAPVLAKGGAIVINGVSHPFTFNTPITFINAIPAKLTGATKKAAKGSLKMGSEQDAPIQTWPANNTFTASGTFAAPTTNPSS